MSATRPMHDTTMPAAPQLDLRFERTRAGRTWLAWQRAGYPFHVGRRLDGARDGDARVIVQSCSGGLFEHDRVAQRLVAADGAHARIETAAATIVHTMTDGHAASHVSIDAHPHARVAWLPEPTILFPRARFASAIDVTLHPRAAVLLADAYLTHDPARGSATFARLDASVAVRDPRGRLLALDRFVLEPGLSGQVGVTDAADAAGRPFAAHGGLFVLIGADAADDEPGSTPTPGGDAAREVAAALAHALAHADGRQAYAGAGLLPGACGAFARILAADAPALRALLSTAVEAASRALDGFSCGAPRALRAPSNREVIRDSSPSFESRPATHQRQPASVPD
ncbi:urease accessory protein UreD [Paraburkholderia caballeronis]|uniref:urease accessory protein UreD n=1 Tax=Paraburkholderia caballeronis TaxID=416943 RepID=UPI0010663F5F|nr:urease accessory protein UreD [Paraburkholderia caballeronis]